MKKQFIFIACAAFLIEPIVVTTTLATTRRDLTGSTSGRWNDSKKKKIYRSQSPRVSPQTRISRKKAATEEKTTINNACLLLAGIIVFFPSISFLASALHRG